MKFIDGQIVVISRSQRINALLSSHCHQNVLSREQWMFVKPPDIKHFQDVTSQDWHVIVTSIYLKSDDCDAQDFDM